jgi:hypothetical protein
MRFNGCDGSGFDVDYDQDGTIVQFNYSHDNEGGFILLCTDAEPRRASVRFNLSVDDELVANQSPCSLQPGATFSGLRFHNTRSSGRASPGGFSAVRPPASSTRRVSTCATTCSTPSRLRSRRSPAGHPARTTCTSACRRRARTRWRPTRSSPTRHGEAGGGSRLVAVSACGPDRRRGARARRSPDRHAATTSAGRLPRRRASDSPSAESHRPAGRQPHSRGTDSAFRTCAFSAHCGNSMCRGEQSWRGQPRGGIAEMLVDRVTDRTRVQCASCGAHAVLSGDDYKELLAHSDGYMRCEVCGVTGPFDRTAPATRDSLALSAR